MAPPTGGPPVARGDAFIVPKAPRTKRRGNPNPERTRDMDKVRKLKEQADREAQEAEARHPEPVATLPGGNETSPCRMTHFADDRAQRVVYAVTRRDRRLGAEYGETVDWTFEGFNGMVEGLGHEGAADIILSTLRAVDESLLAEVNRARRERGLPVLRHAMSRWQDPLVLADPPLSQATKKGGNVPITQEMSQDFVNVADWQGKLLAQQLDLISGKTLIEGLQNITGA